MPLGTLKVRVLISKGRYYSNFGGLRFHWALVACLRWSSGTLGLPWVPVDSHWGSICYLWVSIGAPLVRHWAPFVAFGVHWSAFGRHWGSLWWSLCDHIRNFWLLNTFKTKLIFEVEQRRMKRPKCENVSVYIGGSKWRILKSTHFPPQNATSSLYAYWWV